MVCSEQVSFMWCLLYTVLAFGQTQAQQPPPTEQQSDDCRSYPSVEERSEIIVRYQFLAHFGIYSESGGEKHGWMQRKQCLLIGMCVINIAVPEIGWGELM